MLNQKIKCKIGLHKYVLTGEKKVITYHKKLNPLINKTFTCLVCAKIKTITTKQT